MIEFLQSYEQLIKQAKFVQDAKYAESRLAGLIYRLPREMTRDKVLASPFLLFCKKLC